MITQNRCKTCGGLVEFDIMAREAECPNCGNLIYLGADRGKFINLYSQADDAWGRKDFDEAIKLYQQIVDEDNAQAEAHFAIALCRYGIAYELDPIKLVMIPTCNRINRESIYNDKNYLAAIKYAKPAEREKYEERAAQIEDISKDFLKIVEKEKPYDLFISYKRNDFDGRRTIDSQVAKKLYMYLTQKGFNVFFAEETLKEIGGEKYEPYIFAALTSSKMMVLFGSCKEYYEATWVKNEWRRFLVLSAEDPSKVILPAFIQCDPYKALPMEFNGIEAFDALGPVFCEEVESLLRKKMGAKPAEKVQGSANGLKDRYAQKEKVDLVVARTDCEPDFAADSLVVHQGNVEKTVEYIKNDSDYKKKLWICAECGASNTHAVCHNKRCGISKEESLKVARQREEIKKKEEHKRKMARINFKKIIGRIFIAIVVIAAIAGVVLFGGSIFKGCMSFLVGEEPEPLVDDLYTPEILTTYSGTYSNGEAIITFTSCDELGNVEGYFEFICDDKDYGKYKIKVVIEEKTISGNITATMEFVEWMIRPSYYSPLDKMSFKIKENYTTLTSSQNSLDLKQGINDKFAIKTADDLKKLNNSSFPYTLANDIDMTGVNWEPVKNFKGSLNGAGYTISNLKISASGENVGFISVLEGSVTNVNFDNAKVSVSGIGKNVGIVCGTMKGHIEDVMVSGEVSAERCTNVGGVFGYAEVNNKQFLMTDLENNAAVTGADYVGGVCGCFTNGYSSGNSNFEKLKNGGDITGRGQYAGGIIGYCKTSNITSVNALENTASVSSKNYVGGLFGYVRASDDSVIMASSSSGAIKAEAVVGCIAGKAENITINECKNDGGSVEATGFITESGNKCAYVGGFAGIGYAANDCVNTVSIEYTQGGRCVGGIFGFAVSNTKQYLSSNLENIGSISGYDYVGGIFGSIENSYSSSSATTTIDKVKNNGTVNGGSNYVGGIAGYVNSSNVLYITSAKNTCDVTGACSVGGVVGYAKGYEGSFIADSDSSSNIKAQAIVGCIAGELKTVIVDGCSNENSTLTATGYVTESGNKCAYVGGYVGKGYGAVDCINKVTIEYTLSGRYVGGILGYSNANQKSFSLSGLENRASVTGYDYVGGIAGYISNDYSSSSGSTTLDGLKNSGKIKASSDYAGGICGYLKSSNKIFVTNCTNSANVQGKSYVGGLIGYGKANYDGSDIQGSTSTGTVSGSGYYGNIAGKLEKITIA